MADIAQLKQLREETDLSISECKEALEEAGGDLEKARALLYEKKKKLAAKKGEREAPEGVIESYVHPNRKVGVLLEVNCESDFVARSEEFRKIAHELCLQVASMNPLYVREEEIPEETLKEQEELAREELRESGKPEDIQQKILEGKLQKFKSEASLLSQTWIKDDSRKVMDLVQEGIAKFGENIVVRRFSRFQI